MCPILSELRRKGGTAKIYELMRNGTLKTVVSEILILGGSRKALEIANLSGQMKVQDKLRRKYGHLIDKPAGLEKEKRVPDKTVWISWIQGMDEAPELVKKCYQSVKKYFNDWNIVVITKENYREYTDFPDYMIDKMNLGMITKTHFSDLLRIELLSRYGGLWLDATVYCTGGLPDEIVHTDFFVYQSLKPGHTGHTVRLSSWLMWSAPQSYFIQQTKKLLWEYWKKEKQMKDYFLLHHMMTMVMNTYEDEALKILPAANTASHILLLRLFEKYDEETWNWICKQTAFHKLTYKFREEQTEMKGTYYKVLFGEK